MRKERCGHGAGVTDELARVDTRVDLTHVFTWGARCTVRRPSHAAGAHAAAGGKVPVVRTAAQQRPGAGRGAVRMASTGMTWLVC